MSTEQHLVIFTIPALTTAPIVLTGFGHSPEAVVTAWNGRLETVDTVTQTNSRRGIGAGIGAGAADHGCWTHLLVDGAPVSQTLSEVFPGTLVSLVAPTGGSDGSARISSIDADGLTLDITTPFAVALQVVLLSWGPGLVTDKAFRLGEAFPAVTGDQDVTGLGFQPTAVIFATIGRELPEPSFSSYCFGLAAGEQGSIEQSVVTGYSRGNGASSDTRRYSRRDSCLALSNEAPNNDVLERRARVTDWIPDGFRLNHDFATAASSKFFGFLALDGPGFRAGSATVGQDRISGLPFAPRGAIFLTHGTLESPDSDVMALDDQSIFGFAAINDTGLDQAGGGTRSEEAQPAQTVATRLFTDGMIGGMEPVNLAAAPDGKLAIVAATNDGFDLSTPDPWDDGDVYFGWLTFGAPQPIVTDGRRAVVPQGSQDPPVATFTKDPSSVLDYALNWDAPLSDTTPTVQDSIVSSTWTTTAPASDPSPLTIEESPPASFVGNETRVWLAAGSASENYNVVNRIETLNGRVYERTIVIQVRER